MTCDEVCPRSPTETSHVISSFWAASLRSRRLITTPFVVSRVQSQAKRYGTALKRGDRRENGENIR